MPQTKRAAAAPDKPKFIKVKTTRIELRKTVPLRVLKEMAAIVEAGDVAQLPDMIRALEVVLDPDQMEKLWAIEVPANNGSVLGPLQELFGEAVEKTFAAYGIGPGE